MRNNKLDSVYGTAALIIILIFGILGGIIATKNIYYKKGQVDALTGNIKYELIENPDQTREWVLIPIIQE